MMLATSLLSLLLAIFVSGASGQYVQTRVQTASFVSSGPISVSKVNGFTQYVIDGVRLDLRRASVVGENADVKILRPLEVPAARVKVYKNRNAVTIDYLGHHFESTESGQNTRQWSST